MKKLRGRPRTVWCFPPTEKEIKFLTKLYERNFSQLVRILIADAAEAEAEVERHKLKTEEEENGNV